MGVGIGRRGLGGMKKQEMKDLRHISGADLEGGPGGPDTPDPQF